MVGAGVGGLCAAVRLAAAGRSVTVLERNEVVGGKLAVRVREGFWFDTGPSLVTLPHLFAEVLALAGLDLHAEVDLVRLDPQFRYQWPDGSTVDVHDDPARTAAAFDAFAPGTGAGAAYRAFLTDAERIWTVAERTFLAGAMDRPREMVRRMRSPRDLLAIDPLRSLHRAAAARFADPRLQQWAGRYATYSGSSPYRAPATLACIAHVEAAHGCWYPRGGLGALCDALRRAAERVGVDVRTGVDVTRIERGAVHTANGERLTARHVVANVDAVHLYRDLVGDTRLTRRVQRAAPSGSGFVVLAGVRGRTPGLAHHNVWFSPSYAAEYDALDHGRPAHDPTIYACVSAVTDPTQAPLGDENWFLLVNVPPGPLAGPADHAELVLRRLAERGGPDLRPRLAFTEVITPTDLQARYRAEGGAIYGTSSDGPRAAFVRPANRSPVPGLFLVGGSSHPGGGLPLVATSGRIVADMILAERP